MKQACYTMPRAPFRLHVRKRGEFAPPPKASDAPAIVAVDRATECHVTPADIAARMVRYLGDLPAGATLEPSAGTGNLSRALLSAGYERARIVQVERHIGLSQRLYDLGAVVNDCFLAYAASTSGRFDRVVMNPPFSDVRKHVAAARALMTPDACLVALVPVTFETNNMETLEQLPDSTFSTAKVRTKIIRIEL